VELEARNAEWGYDAAMHNGKRDAMLIGKTYGVLAPVLVGALLMGACAHGPKCAVLPPAQVQGWMPVGPVEEYDADSLFDYIDGGAEVYRAFNVQRVYARRYAKPGAPELIADVFDMGLSQDAYGAYHHDVREGESVGLGQESERMGGTLSFWKGRYFVSLIAFDDTPETRAALLALGRTIAADIKEEGHPPGVMAFLPDEGLMPHHVHFLHNDLCLNLHYFIAEENLLNLDQGTNGALAQYRPREDADGGPSVFLVIQYPDAAACKAAHEQFMQGYLPDADAEGMARTENGLWAGAVREGPFFIGVFDAPVQAEVRRLIAEARSKLEGGGEL